MVGQISNWLKSYSFKTSKNYLKLRLESHPDYPSLVAIEDTLNELGVISYACKGTKEELAGEEKPFLAHLNIEERPLQYFENVAQAEKMVVDFGKKWSGNVMFIDKIEGHYNEQHRKLFRAERINSIFSMLLGSIFIGALLFLWALQGAKIIHLLIFLTSLAGTFLSWLITEKEIGVRNSVSDKICGAIKFNRCESVLFSRGARISKVFSWSDIGITYFTTSLFFLSYLLLVKNDSAILVFCWISIAALSFLPYSVYYQWKVVRQWCALCLGVLTLLIFNAVIAIIQLNNTADLVFLPEPMLIFFVLSIGVLSAWKIFSGYWQVKIRSLASVISETKLKRNSKVFHAVLEKGQFNPKNLPLASDPIRFGGSEPIYSLVVACNPYCTPCAEAHHATGWTGPTDCANVEPADAQALAQQQGMMWCCSSCDASRAAAGLPPLNP